jgi:hypothetical protein
MSKAQDWGSGADIAMYLHDAEQLASSRQLQRIFCWWTGRWTEDRMVYRVALRRPSSGEFAQVDNLRPFLQL